MSVHTVLTVLGAATTFVVAVTALVRAITTDRRLSRHEAAVSEPKTSSGPKHAGSPYG